MRYGLLLLTLLASLTLAQERAPLRVMTDVWPPFRMLGADGHLVGLDIDLLAELGKRTGLRFEVQRVPWARGLAELQQGKADLMTGLAKNPERERYVDYLARPYYACAPRFYAAPAFAAALTDYPQLRAHPIGYVLESVYFEPFDSDRQLEKRGVSSETQLLQMLVRGRLPVVIGTDCQVDYELRDPALAAQIAKARYQPAARTELFLGFSRQRPLRAERQQIAEALEQMLAEGWVEHAAKHYQPQP